MIHVDAENLFGRHVIRRPGHQCRGTADFFENLRQTEVHDLHDAIGRYEEIGRLDVTMNDTLRMRIVEPLSPIYISEPTRPRLNSYAGFCLKKKNA